VDRGTDGGVTNFRPANDPTVGPPGRESRKRSFDVDGRPIASCMLTHVPRICTPSFSRLHVVPEIYEGAFSRSHACSNASSKCRHHGLVDSWQPAERIESAKVLNRFLPNASSLASSAVGCPIHLSVSLRLLAHHTAALRFTCYEKPLSWKVCKFLHI
jgi:hypothetical protein